MQETLYLLGSAAAIGLLCAHVGLLVARRLRPPTSPRAAQRWQDLDQIRRELWAELHAMREEHAAAFDELHERIDFAERLLTQDRPGAPERPEPTPV